jgi:hypothetical protein
MYCKIFKIYYTVIIVIGNTEFAFLNLTETPNTNDKVNEYFSFYYIHTASSFPKEYSQYFHTPHSRTNK